MAEQLTAEHTPAPNPLSRWMRQPEIYIRLPSQGYFSENNDYELSIDNELGIAAMTTSDDILLKSPEGLLNGESMATVIRSCAPGIKNVKKLPAPDVDAILLGIRLATYGDNMEFEVQCPECQTQNTYNTSLSYALENISLLESNYPIKLNNELTVFIRPFYYEDSVKEALQRYHEAQALTLLSEADLEDLEKTKKYTESITKIADLMTELCASCVIKIIDPNNNQIEATRADVFEWVKNLSKKDAQKITDKVTEINNTGVNKEVEIVCNNEECKHEWKAQISFDPSYFFV